MPLMTSSTTSASGTSPRHWRQIARGKTVLRPPMRWIVRSPWRSTGAAAGVAAGDDGDPMAPGEPAPHLRRTGSCPCRRPGDASNPGRRARGRAAGAAVASAGPKGASCRTSCSHLWTTPEPTRPPLHGHRPRALLSHTLADGRDRIKEVDRLRFRTALAPLAAGAAVATAAAGGCGGGGGGSTAAQSAPPISLGPVVRCLRHSVRPRPGQHRPSRAGPDRAARNRRSGGGQVRRVVVHAQGDERGDDRARAHHQGCPGHRGPLPRGLQSARRERQRLADAHRQCRGGVRRAAIRERQDLGHPLPEADAADPFTFGRYSPGVPEMGKESRCG